MKKILVFAFAAVFAALSFAAEEKVGGFTWCYSIVGDHAVIERRPGWNWVLFKASTVTVPQKLGGTQVKAIGERAFTGINVAVIMNGQIEEIGQGAFMGASFKGVTIPSGVKNIGASAFRYCDGIQEVIVPASVTNVSACAFAQCQNLQKVTFRSRTTNIDDTVFYGSTNQVVIPK